MVTVPSQLPLPVPAATCSRLPSNLPERASTYTLLIDGSPWSRPETRVSQARWEVLPCHTTRRGASLLVTRLSWWRATVVACPLCTRGVMVARATLLRLRDRGVEHVAVGVGDDDEVAADDGQAAPGALVGRVLEAAGRDHRLGDEAVVLADLEGRGLLGDQRAGRVAGHRLGVLASSAGAGAGATGLGAWRRYGEQRSRENGGHDAAEVSPGHTYSCCLGHLGPANGRPRGVRSRPAPSRMWGAVANPRNGSV